MNKTLLLAAAACVFAANASASEIKPVVGLDYIYSSADIDKIDGVNFFEKNLNTYGISAGAKFNEYVGVEAFYQQSSKEKKKFANGETTDKYKAYGVDVIGYMPVVDNVDLLGSVGVGQYDVDTKMTSYTPALSEKSSDDGLGVRLGIGAQYNVTENWAARVMARYSWLDVDGIDNMTEVSAGVRYSF